MAAFAEGSQSGADPSNDTTSSGVFVEAIPDTELTVCGGRPAPIRRRERHAIAMLVVVTARFVDALGWRDRGALIADRLQSQPPTPTFSSGLGLRRSRAAATSMPDGSSE